MQVDAIDLRLRQRRPWEAVDLGVRLCQRELRAVYRCYWLVAMPFAAIALASVEIASWLPGLLIWWGKPWLDRTVLFVLARAGFGLKTTLGDLWRAQRQVWWSQLLLTWTLRRLSLRRSFTQPVYQIEGIPLRSRGPRLRLMRRRSGAVAVGVTGVFSLVETCLTFSVLSLAWWFAPPGLEVDLGGIFVEGDAPVTAELLVAASYAIVVWFLEPFYVAAGFGLYLNRRVELEAWDIEQEFRRSFPMPSRARVAAAIATVAMLLGLASGSRSWAQTADAASAAAGLMSRPSESEVNRALETLANDPNLADERKVRILTLKGERDAEKSDERGGLIKWLAEFFRWLASSARWLFWLGIAIAFGFLAVYLWRLVAERRAWSRAARAVLPTHVQDLDIRPESLPNDIGAAARALWDRGEQRAALSLLYRGTVSRLVHVHHVAIRQSSTEGDCVRLAAESLAGARIEYVTRSIRTWQRAVYGGVMPHDAAVHELCAGFAGALDAPPENDAQPALIVGGQA